jgi:hypothetical protein
MKAGILKNQTKWNILFAILAAIPAIIAIYSIIPSNILNPQQITPYTLHALDGNQRLFFQEIDTNQYIINNNFISEAKVLKSPPLNQNFKSGESFEFQIQFISNPAYNLPNERIRIFFIDPTGIIRYEYPIDATKVFLSTSGRIELNKGLTFKVELKNEKSEIIDGTWSFKIFLLNDMDEVISEIQKPVNISTEGENSLILILSVLGLLFLGSVYLYFYSLKKGPFSSDKKSLESKKMEFNSKEFQDALQKILNVFEKSKGKWEYRSFKAIVKESGLSSEDTETVLKKSPKFRQSVKPGKDDYWTLTEQN